MPLLLGFRRSHKCYRDTYGLVWIANAKFNRQYLLETGPPHWATSHFTYIRGLTTYTHHHEQTSCGDISQPICSHSYYFRKVLSTKSSDVVNRHVFVSRQPEPHEQIAAYNNGVIRRVFVSRQPEPHEQIAAYNNGVVRHVFVSPEHHKPIAAFKPTKSDILIASLGSTLSKQYLSDHHSCRVDLSFQAPRTIATYGEEYFKTSKAEAASLIVDPKEMSLMTFLSFYMLHLDPITPHLDDIYSANCSVELQVYTRKFLNDTNFAWLHNRGYDITYLTTWRWILSAESSELCATRLVVSAKDQNHGFIGGRIPVFLILFLLRRDDINGPALRIFLNFIWNRLLEQEAFEAKVRSGEIYGRSPFAASKEMGEFLIFDQHSMMILIVRLLRHARKVWPQALPSIAALAARYLGRRRFKEKSSPMTRHSSPYSRDSSPNATGDPDHAKWSFLLNSLLVLLALPSKKHPLSHIIFHEQAQFIIIRKMTEYNPALIVDRRGYRALARVQIAHRKTPAEREWAMRKLQSWPPWKKVETRRDLDVNSEEGISRAAEVIMRSEEAGYAELDWERDAKVLTGWDTDNSPTIQTRRVPVASRSQPQYDPYKNDRLWGARITATRTAPEAWACFLTYQDSQKQPKARLLQAPYFAMYEKIIFEQKRKSVQKAGEHNPLPGDGIETWKIPEPQEAIYVRTPVPNPDEFFQIMLKDNIVPNSTFLVFLLRHAKTLERGYEYIEVSTISSISKKALIEDPPSAEICKVNDKIFTAYVGLLCRHALTSRQLRDQPNDSTSLERAFRLLDLRQPSYWGPWSFLMKSLASKGTVVDTELYSRNTLVQDSLAWSVMCHWLHRMRSVPVDLEFDCFHRLCIGLEKATCASAKLLQELKHGTFRGPEDQINPSERLEKLTMITQNAERVLADGPSALTSCFENLVAVGTAPNLLRSSDSMEGSEMSDYHLNTLLPTLHEVPHPVHLHAYIRVLGLYHDYEGILRVVQWMNCFAKPIHAESGEHMNGKRGMRTLMAAIRLFVEGSWPFDDDPIKDLGGTTDLLEAAPEEIYQKVSEIIKRQELWGGWASDDEVEQYIHRHTPYR